MLICLAAGPLLHCSEDPSREQPGELVLERAIMPVPIQKASAAVYLRIRNGESQNRIIESVHCSLAQRSEIHRSLEDDGLMKMVPVPSLVLPAGQTIQMEPGGLHIMLIGLDRIPEQGEEIDLTLHFQNGFHWKIQVEAVDPAEALP